MVAQATGYVTPDLLWVNFLLSDCPHLCEGHFKHSLAFSHFGFSVLKRGTGSETSKGSLQVQAAQASRAHMEGGDGLGG